MARLINTVMDPKAQTAYGRGRLPPVLTMAQQGQFGQQVEMAGYVSSTPYVRKNLIVKVLEVPRGFNDLDEPQDWIAAYKSLIETHAKRVEGFQAQLTVDVVSTPFGGAGEEIESPSDVKRQRSSPSFTWVDKYGRPIATFWDQYIMELIGDPISKTPNVMTRAQMRNVKLPDLLPDYIGGTIIVFEPDPTFTLVDKAWLVTNFWPKSGAPVEGIRDLTSSGDMSEFSIEFANICQVGLGVNKLAQRLLNEMNLTGTNPNNRDAFIQAVDPLLGNGIASAVGYTEQMDRVARETVAT